MLALLAKQSEILGKLHSHLKVVNRFPHVGQGKVIRAFFNEKKRIIQSQWGRSTGKTEDACYISWRFALLNPGTETYIICPELKQAKKIYWLKRRLQNYGPQEFVAEHRESELRVVFKNGSYIILDGCENYEALRGIKPDLVIYDEFQHHTQYFDEEVMQPNLSSGKVSLVVFGTPPKRHCYYVEFRENLLNKIKAGNKYCAYFELESWNNPTLDREWLAEKKKELIARDRYNVWLREYEGRLVFDTESAIFPFFDEKKHVKAHSHLVNLIHRDRKKLRWYAFYDPGTTTVFAALYIAVNPYTSQIFILDEIYAEDRRECTAQAIYRRSEKIKSELFDYEDEWTEYYDEAAAWFANEVQDLFGRNLMPTRKQRTQAAHDEGRPGESVLNSAFQQENCVFISDRCKKFVWELTSYVLGTDGKYPKGHDHLMDCFFYFANNTSYSLIEDVDPDSNYDETKAARRSPQTIAEAIHEAKSKNDPSFLSGEDYYDDDPSGGIWN
jgi:hypothetical protein